MILAGWSVARLESEVLEYNTDTISDPTSGEIRGDNFYFIPNTGICNLENDRIPAPAKLEPVQLQRFR